MGELKGLCASSNKLCDLRHVIHLYGSQFPSLKSESVGLDQRVKGGGAWVTGPRMWDSWWVGGRGDFIGLKHSSNW